MSYAPLEKDEQEVEVVEQEVEEKEAEEALGPYVYDSFQTVTS
jgi:hypothetical protein